MGEERAVDIIYFDFSTALHGVSHNILIDKLMKCELNDWTKRWTENGLNSRSQKVVMSDTESGWRPVTSGVPRGQYWAPCCLTFSSVIWTKR